MGATASGMVVDFAVNVEPDVFPPQTLSTSSLQMLQPEQSPEPHDKSLHHLTPHPVLLEMRPHEKWPIKLGPTSIRGFPFERLSLKTGLGNVALEALTLRCLFPGFIRCVKNSLPQHPGRRTLKGCKSSSPGAKNSAS